MKLLTPSLIALLALTHVAAADPITPAFTYQGRLDQNGAPADGSFDLKFELYDAAADGNLIGAAIELPAQTIAGGLMTADLDFGGPVVFDGTAYWVQASARTAGAPDYVAVPGRTAIRPTPYAIHALSAATVKDGAITGSSLANGAVSAAKLAPAAVGLSQLNLLAPPVPGQVLSTNGVDLTWINPGGGGGVSGPWQLNAGTGAAFYNTGNVGIGTSTPARKLTVQTSGTGYGIEHTNGTVRLATYLGGSAGGGWLGTVSNHPLNFFVNDGGAVMSVNTDSSVSMTGGSPGTFVVGTPNGESGSSIVRGGNRADVRFNGTSLKLVAGVGTGPPLTAYGIEITTGGAVSMTGGSPGSVTFGTPAAETGQSIVRGGNRADVRFDGTTLKMVAGPGIGAPGSFNGLNVHTSGNVGIGTNNPSARLDVIGDVSATRLVLRADPAATTNAAVLCADPGVVNFVPFNTATGKALSIVVRDASVRKLTITGGADLAEPFAMSQDGLEPGTVVVIDEKNPGKLKRSTHAYDRKVAGIVSGANGIEPGISMIQEDKLEAGENVALSGRVYVKADASAGSIEPGDLLTTSSTAGHAMKAAAHDQAQGAILGKAMTSLSDGTGMVLVLVSLQ